MLKGKGSRKQEKAEHMIKLYVSFHTDVLTDVKRQRHKKSREVRKQASILELHFPEKYIDLYFHR